MTAALVGDGTEFGTLVARHRRELYAHCLRMLRSPERAEDALQEALLRAWRSRSGYAGRASVRSWLYRIATNVCLDEIRRDPGRQLLPLDEGQSDRWVTAPADGQPDVVVEARETLERAFLTTVELLPPRQRAVLILCDVLRCSAAEAAALLGTSVPAVNSARQRARATLGADAAERPRRWWRPRPADRALLERYVEALRRHDVAALAALALADAAGAR